MLINQAVNYYSRAHNIKPDDPIILSNRCAAYLKIGHFLKHRPAAASELRPLSGLDPTTHASVCKSSSLFFQALLFLFTFVTTKSFESMNSIQLALKDAEHFMNLQNHTVMAYILKANALILVRIRPQFLYHTSIHDTHLDHMFWQLERFEQARDVILTGLQLDASRYVSARFLSTSRISCFFFLMHHILSRPISLSLAML